MRGISINRSGGIADMLLKVAPIACTFLAFLFLGISLFSGIKPNFLEDLSLIKFDTSTLTKTLLLASAFSDTASNTACKKAGTVITDASNTSQQDTLDIFATKRSIQTPFYSSTFDKNACNDTADALGINEYYSLHLNGAFCEGGFGDNDAKPEVVRCSSPMVVQGVAGLDDLREMLRLDEELQFGAGLDKIGFAVGDGVLSALDLISRLVEVMGVVVLVAVGGIGGGFLLSTMSFVLELFAGDVQGLVLLAAMGLTGLGVVMGLVGVVGVTVVREKVKGVVNREGEGLGVSAATGPGLYATLWTSLGLSVVAFALLVVVWWRGRSGKEIEVHGEPEEKDQAVSSGVDADGFYEEPLSGGSVQATLDMYGRLQSGRF